MRRRSWNNSNLNHVKNEDSMKPSLTATQQPLPAVTRARLSSLRTHVENFNAVINIMYRNVDIVESRSRSVVVSIVKKQRAKETEFRRTRRRDGDGRQRADWTTLVRAPPPTQRCSRAPQRANRQARPAAAPAPRARSRALLCSVG